ncbi:MAG: hypothetical protein AAFY72_16445 [Cyanobacteria bacterium J06649_4]
MAYDSDTYGQSPFGNPSKKPGKKPEDLGQPSTPKTIPVTPIADDGLDRGPDEAPYAAATTPPYPPAPEFPPPPVMPPAPTARAATQTASQTISNIAGKFSLGKLGFGLGAGLDAQADAQSLEEGDVDTATTGRSTRAKGKSSRASRSTTAKSTGKRSSTKSSTKTTRKSKKAKAAEAAKVEAEAAEAAVAQRFLEEDRNAYFSLIYKTGISALIWAVLMLLRYELPDNADAVINFIINPLLISGLSLVCVVGLMFWLRRLVNDLAYHTQQLHTDAEVSEGKNYRPTLEIVGDALEYNPKLRRNITFFFDAASTLLCTLVSYLAVSAVFGPLEFLKS